MSLASSQTKSSPLTSRLPIFIRMRSMAASAPWLAVAVTFAAFSISQISPRTLRPSFKSISTRSRCQK